MRKQAISLALPALVLLSACAGGGADMSGGAAPDTAVPYIADLALPFGEARTVCDVPQADLGTAVETGASYTLYDTNPGTTGPRTQFVGGLKGGCAVQFTAAMAMFGDVGTHEVVRYNPANASRAYSDADIAYEQIKASYCGAPQGESCGAKIDDLAARSTFVTVYQAFGTNPTWAEIFVHEGEMIIIAREGR